MRRGALLVAWLSTALVSGSAWAMTSGTVGPDCVVTGGDKLSAETGPDAICTAVREALAKRAVNSPVKVAIQVASPSRLKATIRVGERVLPIEEFAVMDRGLSKGMIERFAQRISEVVAEAS